MNIDTDTQWSYWEGIKIFEEKYHDYLQGQIGNPDGDDKPNKKYYDVRSTEEDKMGVNIILILTHYLKGNT
jgi:fructose-bisphosphate aldolase class II